MLFYISISILLLSLILLINNFSSNKTSIYLSLFLVIFSLYTITHYLVLFGQNAYWLALFYNHLTPLYLLLGPLLLFYVRGTITNCASLYKRDIWHFIPAVIHTIGILPYIALPFELKLKNAELLISNIGSISSVNINLFFNLEQRFIIRLGLFILYTLYCGYILFKASPSFKFENPSIKKQMNLKLRWLSILLICSLVLAAYFLIITIIFIKKAPKDVYNNSYNIHVIGAGTYFILAFSLLLFPNILYGVPRKIYIENIKSKKSKTDLKNKDTSESKSNQDPLFELSEKIKAYLNNEKPYLDPDFSISMISNEMQVTESQVSYCINTILDTNFFNIRAELRVNHAINLLQTEAKQRLTLAAIGEQSGFKTRSNFYKIFKEKTGMTPSEFITKNNKEI
jgi:AraC-like DNA-binding protein